MPSAATKFVLKRRQIAIVGASYPWLWIKAPMIEAMTVPCRHELLASVGFSDTGLHAVLARQLGRRRRQANTRPRPAPVATGRNRF